MKLHDVPQALSERVMDYVVSTWNTRLLIYHANCLMSWDWSTRLLIYHAKYRKSWDCSTWLLIYHANCFKSWDWKEGLAFTIPQEVFGNPTAPRAGFKKLLSYKLTREAFVLSLPPTEWFDLPCQLLQELELRGKHEQ